MQIFLYLYVVRNPIANNIKIEEKTKTKSKY